MTDEAKGPLVQVAALVERAIVEDGTGVLSLVSLVEEITVPQGADARAKPVSLTLVVCLWAAGAGTGTVTIHPFGENVAPPEDADVDIRAPFAEAEGINIVQRTELIFNRAGQYGFDVLFREDGEDAGRVLSRIPLKVTLGTPPEHDPPPA